MADVGIAAPFASYKGTGDFIFVSYSHLDGAAVFPELAYLRDQGYRIWYDEGIDPGNEWPEEVAKALADASYFLVFISPHAVASQNVRNEINFAIARKKRFLAVFIEDTTLPVGLELQMGSIQAVMRFRMTKNTFRHKMLSVLPRELQMSDDERGQGAGDAPFGPTSRGRSNNPFWPRGVGFIAGGWSVAWLAGTALHVETIVGGKSGWTFEFPFSINIAAAIGGAIGGLATAIALSRNTRPLAMKHIVAIVAAWAVAWSLTYYVTELLGVGVLTPIGAIVTVSALRLAGSRMSLLHMFWIVVLWEVGSILGMMVAAGLYAFGAESIAGQYISWAIAGGLMGLFGGVPTLFWGRRI